MDMIVRLLGNNSGFDTAMKSSSRTTASLNTSLDRLTASMQQEIQTGVTVASSKKQLIDHSQLLEAADRGASNAKVEYALALRSELEALRELHLAEQREAEIKQQNLATIQQIISAKRMEAQADSVSTRFLDLKALAEAGATEAEIDEYMALTRLIDKQNQLNAARERTTQATQRSTQAGTANMRGANTLTLAVQALAFGVQDAAQVYGTMGLAGALSASANNLIFMTSLLNPQLAIITALAVAGGQLAGVYFKIGSAAKEAAEREIEMVDAQKKHLDLIGELSTARADFERKTGAIQTRDEAKGNLERVREEGARLDAEFKAAEEKVGSLNKLKEKTLGLNEGRVAASPLGRMLGYDNKKTTPELNKAIAEQNAKLADIEKRRQENLKQQEIAANKLQERNIVEGERERRNKIDNIKVEQYNRQAEQEQKAREDKKKADEQYLQDWVNFAKEINASLLTEEQQARNKANEDRMRREAQISKWIAEGRIDALGASFLQSQSRTVFGKDIAQIQQREQAKANAEQVKALQEQKKQVDDELGRAKADRNAPDNRAITANSAEGMKLIFDAMGGITSPQREVSKNTAKQLQVLQNHSMQLDRMIKALEKLNPIKVGG